MTSAYPGALDALKTGIDGNTDTLASVPHDALHNDANAAIIAVQHTLGVNPQGDYTTVADRIADAASSANAPQPVVISALAPASPDIGLVWVARPIASGYVAVDGDGNAHISDDGASWLVHTTGLGSVATVASSAAAAVTIAGGPAGVAYSRDGGVSWFRSDAPTGCTALCWSTTLGAFVGAFQDGAQVQPAKSIDGISWTLGVAYTGTAATSALDITYDSQAYFLNGTSSIYHSSDGLTFTLGAGAFSNVRRPAVGIVLSGQPGFAALGIDASTNDLVGRVVHSDGTGGQNLDWWPLGGGAVAMAYGQPQDMLLVSASEANGGTGIFSAYDFCDDVPGLPKEADCWDSAGIGFSSTVATPLAPSYAAQLAWSDDRAEFIAAAADGSGFATSPDGLTWTTHVYAGPPAGFTALTPRPAVAVNDVTVNVWDGSAWKQLAWAA